ncbi:MAG TPA: TlpA disulfide reductase family protein [Gemmatimonadaceae bacterium]|nr:TlpA disulfide reductase family protein [Gemmatimonadaceae bacterium]
MSKSKPRPRWRFWSELALWVALLAFVGHRIWPQAAAALGIASSPAPAAGNAGPQFALTTLDGEAVTSQELRGKVVLLNFWATWCPPCRLEMPGFESVYNLNKDRGFIVLGVSMDGADPAAVRQFLADHHITYPVAMATQPVVQTFGNVNLLPTSFLIDRQGRVRNQVQGVFASVALDQAVKHLLDEPAPAGGSLGAGMQ